MCFFSFVVTLGNCYFCLSRFLIEVVISIIDIGVSNVCEWCRLCSKPTRGEVARRWWRPACSHGLVLRCVRLPTARHLIRQLGRAINNAEHVCPSAMYTELEQRLLNVHSYSLIHPLKINTELFNTAD